MVLLEKCPLLCQEVRDKDTAAEFLKIPCLVVLEKQLSKGIETVMICKGAQGADFLNLVIFVIKQTNFQLCGTLHISVDPFKKKNICVTF